MYRWRQWDVEIISALMILLAGLMLWSASGCDTAKRVGGEVGGTAAEWIACPVIPGLDCGHVFVCATPAENALGQIELCIDDDNEDATALADAEAIYGPCEPTPRHQGICVFCPEERGCNAFNGCFGCP